MYILHLELKTCTGVDGHLKLILIKSKY